MSVTSDKEMFLKFLDIDKLVTQRNLETLEGIIYWSVLTKLKHVSNDYKEKSMRLILNYGHTFGQAIETYYGLYQEKLKHGEAISLDLDRSAHVLLPKRHQGNAAIALPTAIARTQDW